MRLEDICNRHDPRAYAHQPFNYKGHAVATNGHVLLVTHERPDLIDINDIEVSPEFFGSLDKMLARVEDRIFVMDLPLITLPDKKPCTTCKGTGKAEITICDECNGEGDMILSSTRNDYWVTCKSCNGLGDLVKTQTDKDCPDCNGKGEEYRDNAHVKIHDIKIAGTYCELLLSANKLKLSPEPEQHMMFFKAGDYKGVVMGLRTPDEPF